MTCWKCQSSAAAPPTCAACGALQPPPAGLDHFAALGVPRRHDLDAAALEARHRELGRRFHPDRFARHDPHERRLSLLWATQVNDAYKVLRDPTRRAEYLLKLRGLDVGDERAGQPAVDPAFLMEILELRETLAAARAARDGAQVASLAADVRAQRAALADEVARGFVELGDRDDAALLGRIARALAAQRYYARFLEEVEAFEDAHEETS